jgi:S-layer protein
VVTFTATNSNATDLTATLSATPGTIAIATATTQQGTSGGTYSGTFTGWSTGAASNDTVNFTSSTVYADVQDLASTLSNSPTITTTNGVDLSIDGYQTTAFTSGWRGFESLYIPEAQSDETLDLSALSNKSIIDLRAGAFSSINILPPETKTALPTTMLRSAQTYMGLNNVALAYGAEVNTVKGGNSADSYFVSDYNVSINDSSGSNQVFLNGQESDWLSSNIRSAETAVAAFKPLSSGQTVTMAGLTFTAGNSGVSANELATAFSGITGSDTLLTINERKVTAGVSDAKGVFTGTPSGWTSGAASSNTVVFTSTTASSNVTNLASTGTSGVQPTIANTDGAAKIYINTLTGQSVELIGNFTIRYYDADKQALTHSNLDLMV